MAKPAGGRAPKKGKKNRKLGRNAKVCASYAASGREAFNARRRLRNHLRKYRNDGQALRAYISRGGSEGAIN